MKRNTNSLKTLAQEVAASERVCLSIHLQVMGVKHTHRTKKDRPANMRIAVALKRRVRRDNDDLRLLEYSKNPRFGKGSPCTV
mmetsp:Transcript_16925/g.27176  ORF Transcript_16925/g.27176 Transcript_16925/m.27176 type:complete len:83 (-) Transcript_16925:691-939(-)